MSVPRLAVPRNFVRRRLVQGEADWRLVLPYVSHHIVSPAQLSGKTIAMCAEHEPTDSAECFCG